eukprot:scaffold61381_cov33-Tisochrysis_lutea.AAC.4
MVPMNPSTFARKSASHTRSAAAFVFPEPAALATSGATEKKHWLAAPWPARASASPIRPTQNVSTAPTSGITARLTIEGSATPSTWRSSASPPLGSASRQRGRPAGSPRASACSDLCASGFGGQRPAIRCAPLPPPSAGQITGLGGLGGQRPAMRCAPAPPPTRGHTPPALASEESRSKHRAVAGYVIRSMGGRGRGGKGVRRRRQGGALRCGRGRR